MYAAFFYTASSMAGGSSELSSDEGRKPSVVTGVASCSASGKEGVVNITKTASRSPCRCCVTSRFRKYRIISWHPLARLLDGVITAAVGIVDPGTPAGLCKGWQKGKPRCHSAPSIPMTAINSTESSVRVGSGKPRPNPWMEATKGSYVALSYPRDLNVAHPVLQGNHNLRMTKIPKRYWVETTGGGAAGVFSILLLNPQPGAAERPQ